MNKLAWYIGIICVFTGILTLYFMWAAQLRAQAGTGDASWAATGAATGAFVEGFSTSATTGVTTVPVNTQKAVMDTFQELYVRQPNSQELQKYSRALDSGQITQQGLRQTLVDAPEYKSRIKMQSNELTPELTKMMTDRDMLTSIANIYQEECGKTIPADMVLPLRDVYIYLGYNEYALRAMLRDQAYLAFEQEVKTTPDMNNPKLMDIFIKYFNKNDLVSTGTTIAAVMKAKATEPVGVLPTCKYDRCVGDTDSDSSVALMSAMDAAQAAFNKNAAARALSEGNTIPDFNTTAGVNEVRIPTHKGDMVLIPEMAWSVPQYRPPVCTTLGQPLLVQPVMDNSKLLLGTPLGSAERRTGVGSIMPSFQHREFVDVPIGSGAQFSTTGTSTKSGSGTPPASMVTKKTVSSTVPDPMKPSTDAGADDGTTNTKAAHLFPSMSAMPPSAPSSTMPLAMYGSTSLFNAASIPSGGYSITPPSAQPAPSTKAK